jgi:hypothetical protein
VLFRIQETSSLAVLELVSKEQRTKVNVLPSAIFGPQAWAQLHTSLKHKRTKILRLRFRLGCNSDMVSNDRIWCEHFVWVRVLKTSAMQSINPMT